MGCDCDAKCLMPVEEAKQAIWQAVAPIKEIELCPLDEALGRVLAQELVSPINVPGYDNSAMDGYALRHQDLAADSPLSVIGKSFAGQPFDGAIGQGQCVRIMTGAHLPSGADTVVMQENTETDGNTMHITKPPRIGNAIRLAGEDIKQGALVLAQGRLLSAIDIGLLASLGTEQVPVVRKLKVAMLCTGDELQTQGKPLAPGQLFDSNRPALRAMLSKLGVNILDLGIIPDNKDAIRNAFKQADSQADLVISSGGVSVGEADYTKEILHEMGNIHFWKLAIKPGKPLAFGRLANSVFFGLPGNPVSAVVTFHKIALPALRLMTGQTPAKNLLFAAKAAAAFKKKPGRTDYQRATCWQDQAGNLLVEPSGNQSSGVLSSMAKSNCYAVLESERGDVSAGDTLTIELFDSIVFN